MHPARLCVRLSILRDQVTDPHDRIKSQAAMRIYPAFELKRSLTPRLIWIDTWQILQKCQL